MSIAANESRLREKAQQIKLVIFDVDGTLTDGRFYFNDKGEEVKIFHVQDGLGFKLLQQANIHIAVISGRQSIYTTRRMHELAVEHVYQGQSHKIPIYEKLLAQFNLVDAQVAAVGDDLPEKPLMERCGLSIAVADAIPEILQLADWVTSKNGGFGAARQACDFILAHQSHKHDI